MNQPIDGDEMETKNSVQAGKDPTTVSSETLRAAQGDGQAGLVWHEVNPNPSENIDEALLPSLDKTVLVIYLSDYDDQPIMAFGGRSDGGEGWLWGVEPSNCCGQDFEAEIVCDDEYRVTHWAEIPWPRAALAAVVHNEEK